jgi:hypothetical protein
MHRRVALGVLALGVCAAGVVALVLSVGAAPNEGSCDNIAGHCLRQRQGYAITGIELLSIVAAICGAVGLFVAVRGRRVSRTLLLALAACAAVAASVIVVQPVEHLNNRFTGWLSDNP